VTQVSVLIPTIGRPSIYATLAALTAQGQPPAFEVIVSIDGPAALDLHDVRTHPACTGLRVTRLEARQGVSVARNAAIALANGTLLGFLDDDVVPDPDWIETVATNLASVTGRIVEDDRTGTLATLRRLAFDHRHHTNLTRGPHVDYLNGGNCAIAHDALRQVGVFDTTYPKSQDRELARRLVHAGFTIGYAPDMVIQHRASYTIKDLIRGRFKAGEAAARMAHDGATTSAGPATLEATYGANLPTLAHRYGGRVAAAACVSAAAYWLGHRKSRASSRRLSARTPAD
jgi:GT2 family glycosyltransferase